MAMQQSIPFVLLSHTSLLTIKNGGVVMENNQWLV
jgi:hypothetical protein